MLLCKAIVFAATYLLKISGATKVPPIQPFVSRPDILAPVLDIKSIDPELVSAGYIFLSTWEGEAQSGPYIYTNEGELIWSGHNPSLPTTEYFNFQSHHLSNGTSVLSVFRGHSDSGRGKGHVALFDSSYQLIRTIESPSPRLALDFHEFDLLDDGNTAIVVSFQPYQGEVAGEGLGWLLDSVFYCIDTETGKVVFEWKASGHIPISESTVRPSTKIGAGLSFGKAFDWFHINSIARFNNGDFLLSARHTDTIYRISREDGSVVWRLGGTQSSFQMQDVNFSAQHDARIVKEPPSSGNVIISFYNNGFNGQTQTHESSSAMIVELNEQAMSARLIREMFPPIAGVAQNTGSMQPIQPSGNFLVSWGQMKGWTGFTEFSREGEVALDVAFADPLTRNYRVRKADWVGRPSTRPDLYIYARDESAFTHFWMSWNGATEVAAWRIVYTETVGRDVIVEVVPNDGFETHFQTKSFVREGFVEALDRDDQILSRSENVKVFVPPAALASSCAESHCRKQILHAKENKGDTKPPVRVLNQMSLRMDLLYGIIVLIVGIALGRTRCWVSLPFRRRLHVPR